MTDWDFLGGYQSERPEGAGEPIFPAGGPTALTPPARPSTAPRTALTGHEGVDHPSHYMRGGLECLDVIEALGLGYHEGNALKYLWRAGHKGTTTAAEDLRKAAWYLMRRADQLEAAERESHGLTPAPPPGPDAKLRVRHIYGGGPVDMGPGAEAHFRASLADPEPTPVEDTSPDAGPVDPESPHVWTWTCPSCRSPFRNLYRDSLLSRAVAHARGCLGDGPYVARLAATGEGLQREALPTVARNPEPNLSEEEAAEAMGMEAEAYRESYGEEVTE